MTKDEKAQYKRLLIVIYAIIYLQNLILKSEIIVI